MGRTRSALLQATAECVARYGVRKTTMVDVASKSRVAKATLYNHFRTKDDVLAAVVEQQVAELIGVAVAEAASAGLVAALELVADRLAANPALRRAAESEQALLAPLMTPGEGRGWQVARDGAAAVLTAGRASSGPDEVELLLRWAASQVLWPLPAERRRAAAEALASGYTASAPVPVVAVPTRPDRPAGLGWPS